MCLYCENTQAIHNEIKELKDEMPWPPQQMTFSHDPYNHMKCYGPPQPNDLQPEHFKMLSAWRVPNYLDCRKNCDDQMSSRQANCNNQLHNTLSTLCQMTKS